MNKALISFTIAAIMAQTAQSANDFDFTFDYTDKTTTCYFKAGAATVVENTAELSYSMNPMIKSPREMFFSTIESEAPIKGVRIDCILDEISESLSFLRQNSFMFTDPKDYSYTTITIDGTDNPFGVYVPVIRFTDSKLYEFNGEYFSNRTGIKFTARSVEYSNKTFELKYFDSLNAYDEFMSSKEVFE